MTTDASVFFKSLEALSRRRTLWLSVAVVLTAMAAMHRMPNEFGRLLFDLGHDGAIDLKIFQEAVVRWFTGQQVYHVAGNAVYPPASYVMMWPMLGWLSQSAARWLWAGTSVAMMVWLAAILLRRSGPSTWLDRALLVLLIPAMYATGATIGNGQLALHVLAPLLTAIWLLTDDRPSWIKDALGAMLFIVALMKPTMSVPMFWLVLFVPRRLRPAVMVVSGYALLTVFASWFQEQNILQLCHAWLDRGAEGAAYGSASGGHSDVHSWLAVFKQSRMNTAVSLLILAGHGLWTWRYRWLDVWVLLAVGGLVARFWAYHRLYDDLLILLPIVTLFRLARGSDGWARVAGALFALTWMASLAPARVLEMARPWPMLFAGGQTFVWLAVLLFLVLWARRQRLARQIV